MASRDIKANLEALRTLVEDNSASAALNVDDDGVQLIEQIGLLCMSDTGLQELSKPVFPMLSFHVIFCSCCVLVCRCHRSNLGPRRRQ